MADWIKMRTSLLTNPKVTKMARTLLANPEFRAWYGNPEVTDNMTYAVTLRHVTVVTRVTVGGLLPVWASVNESAGRDGHLRHAGLFEIDVTAGIPGFGAAMEAAEWLTVLPENEGLEFANFIEHNTVGQERSTHAKTAAERAKEYRDRKAAERAAGVTNGVTEKRDASRDTVTTDKKRVEKSRKKKGAKAPLSAENLPTWMQDLVNLYHEVLPELPGIRVMDKDRDEALRAFWDWVLTTNRPDGSPRAKNEEEAMGWVRDYFQRARNNDFIMGRGTRSADHKNWRCSIEYLLSSRGMKKVIEETAETP